MKTNIIGYLLSKLNEDFQSRPTEKNIALRLHYTPFYQILPHWTSIETVSTLLAFSIQLQYMLSSYDLSNRDQGS